jgi:hypothetical protein
MHDENAADRQTPPHPRRQQIVVMLQRTKSL